MVEFEQTLGCLLGGAVGDALGAPYENLWSESIPDSDELLAEFGEFHGYPRGQYTDDTQLTLATIEAIVHRQSIDPHCIATLIADLWQSQAVVGPGDACTRAADGFLANGDWRTCGAPVGQAGNGTAMRTAAIGLYFARDPSELPQQVADISRITHSDPRSIAGGVAIAKATQISAVAENPAPAEFCRAIADGMVLFHEDFAKMVRQLPSLLAVDED